MTSPAREAALERINKAARLFEGDLSEYCDGPERDELREAFAALDALPTADDDRYKCSFDVGAGRVREGDKAIYEGRECRVLTVYSDGDVQIEVSTYPTVKWRQVTPLPPPPRPEKPDAEGDEG